MGLFFIKAIGLFGNREAAMRAGITMTVFIYYYTKKIKNISK